jgi:CHASE2 domain-containing sensor protein
VASFAAVAGAARAAERPEVFWQCQREAISRRLPGQALVTVWKRWVWATGTVALLVLGSCLLSRQPQRPVPVEAPTVSDDALLLSVQQSIHSDLPQALRPASLLTQEIDRAAAARGTP